MLFYPESIVGSQTDGITHENEYASDGGKKADGDHDDDDDDDDT